MTAQAFKIVPQDPLDFDGLLGDLAPGQEIYLPATQVADAPHQPFPSTQFPWPPKLCLDLALGYESEPIILAHHAVSEAEYRRFKQHPAFRRDLATAATAIREEGLSFKMKCRLFAEEYLEEIYLQLADKNTGVTTRFDMFTKLVKLGGLEPAPEKQGANDYDSLPRIAIMINL